MNNDLISRSALHGMISLDTKHGTYGEFMDGSRKQQKIQGKRHLLPGELHLGYQKATGE